MIPKEITRFFIPAIVLAAVLAGLQPVLAQQSQLGMFQSRVSDNPIIAGEGIMRFMIQGDNLMTQGRTENAILAYDNAVAQNPYFAEAYIKRAIAKFRLGRVTEAQEDYRFATRLNPYVADLYGYGNNLRKLNILAFEPHQLMNQAGATEENEWLNRGINRKMAGDIIGALADFETAMTLGEEPNPGLYKLRGNVFLLMGNYLAAEMDYTTAIELQPDFAEAYYNRGIARILGYNRPDACDDFQHSARMGYSRGLEQLQYLCSY